jgi:hypothetical protein
MIPTLMLVFSLAGKRVGMIEANHPKAVDFESWLGGMYPGLTKTEAIVPMRKRPWIPGEA